MNLKHENEFLLLELYEKIERLEAAIREHRDQKGDDRCWLDDLKLYDVLGETPPALSLPPKCEFLESCARYWEQRQRPEEKVVSNYDMTMRQLQDKLHRAEECIRDIAWRANYEFEKEIFSLIADYFEISVEELRARIEKAIRGE